MKHTKLLCATERENKVLAAVERTLGYELDVDYAWAIWKVVRRAELEMEEARMEE